MNFQTSIKTCFNKYADFSGRALRSEFWWFVLFVSLGSIVVTIIDIMILGYPIEVNGPLYLIFLVAIFHKIFQGFLGIVFLDYHNICLFFYKFALVFLVFDC